MSENHYHATVTLLDGSEESICGFWKSETDARNAIYEAYDMLTWYIRIHESVTCYA